MVTNGIYVKVDQPEEGLFNQWYTVEFVSFNEFHIDFCNVTDTTHSSRQSYFLNSSSWNMAVIYV